MCSLFNLRVWRNGKTRNFELYWLLRDWLSTFLNNNNNIMVVGCECEHWHCFECFSLSCSLSHFCQSSNFIIWNGIIKVAKIFSYATQKKERYQSERYTYLYTSPTYVVSCVILFSLSSAYPTNDNELKHQINWNIEKLSLKCSAKFVKRTQAIKMHLVWRGHRDYGSSSSV